MSLTFTTVDQSHVNICAMIDRESFNTEVFDAFTIASFLSTPYVKGFLATLNDIPIGYSLFSTNADEGDLLTIAILPEYRGKGYGEKLLQKTLNGAKEANLQNLFLEVRVSNNNAIALYKKHNAKQVGVRKNYYNKENSSEKENALVMIFQF